MSRTTGLPGPSKGSKRRGFGRLRQERSGRWSAAYVGPDGVLYKGERTFDSQMNAEGWLAGERKLIDLDSWLPPVERGAVRKVKAATFGAFSEAWLKDRKVAGRPLKPRTRDHYQRLLDGHLLPQFGDFRLTQITPESVGAWYDQLQAQGTPTLTAHAYSLLRTILASAVPKPLSVNPCQIRGAGSTKRRHKVTTLTTDELRVLVEAMPPKYRAMVLLAAWCALRFGELAELRRKDVDLTNGVIHVRRGAVRTSEGVLIGTPKSDAGQRDVAIPPVFVPAIRDHIEQHAQTGREGLLFPAASGGTLAPSTLYGKNPTRVETGNGLEWRGGTCFYRARALAGHPDLHFHDLRHTGAVLAAQVGATLAELMGRLGHSTPAAALRYQHAAADRDKTIAEALSRMAEQ